jgi:P27 family predicted phage terminase small subunit
MGRPRVPTKLKIIKGTDQPCRTNPDEPDPETEIPEIPHHLSYEAKVEWNRMAPILEEMGLISKIDMAAFAMYCQSWGDFVKAGNMINRIGRSPKDSKERQNLSMWMKESKDARLMAHKFLVEFGLTPASRTRVSSKKKKEPDKKGKWAI